jgi:hypothetical protein
MTGDDDTPVLTGRFFASDAVQSLRKEILTGLGLVVLVDALVVVTKPSVYLLPTEILPEDLEGRVAVDRVQNNLVNLSAVALLRIPTLLRKAPLHASSRRPSKLRWFLCWLRFRLWWHA